MDSFDLRKEFEWQRHLLYQILTNLEINQEKTMATVADVQAKVAKLSTDLDAFIASHPAGAATPTDLDAIGAAIDAADAKLVTP